MSTFLQRVATDIVDGIIARAKRTPYFPLPGYMERYWLLKPRWWTLGCGVRVHHILRSDADRVLHDHPWPFVTIILRGGYLEARPVLKKCPSWIVLEPTASRWHGPGSVLVRCARARHRLVIPITRTAWTLFLMGPKVQTWGFYTSEGKVRWDEYLPAPDATYQREQMAIHEGTD